MTKSEKKSPHKKSANPPNPENTDAKGERIAKVMSRAGVCSRRDAERWIEEGRVKLNGKTLSTPVVTVNENDNIVVDGKPLPTREPTRMWLYHKPRGLLATNKDPEGRPTIFSKFPDYLPRVLTVGRLDFNTEGLMLLTNDGGLARILELPSTGWLRRYRVRAYGRISQKKLDTLKNGIEIDGIYYGEIDAKLVSQKKDNYWMEICLREGKNREIKKVLEHFGMEVGRLIRTSFGPFQLGELPKGAVKEVARRVLREQIGKDREIDAGLDFSTPVPQRIAPRPNDNYKKRSPSTFKQGKSMNRSSSPTRKSENTYRSPTRKPVGAPRNSTRNPKNMSRNPSRKSENTSRNPIRKSESTSRSPARKSGSTSRNPTRKFEGTTRNSARKSESTSRNPTRKFESPASNPRRKSGSTPRYSARKSESTPRNSAWKSSKSFNPYESKLT